jgi:hypothetical protein
MYFVHYAAQYTVESVGRIWDSDDPNGPLLKGRTHPAGNISLTNNGKEICAMIGEDPVVGIAGYGHSVQDALKNLANELIRNGVWIEAPIKRTPRQLAPLKPGTFVANAVQLYLAVTDGRTWARIRAELQLGEVSAGGETVPDALESLAKILSGNGVWIEVTDPNHPFG